MHRYGEFFPFRGHTNREQQWGCLLLEAAGVIVQISSIAIAKSEIGEHLRRLQRDVIPAYEAALGIVSIQLLRRSLVAYDELLTISVWESEDVLVRFLETLPLGEPPTFGESSPSPAPTS